ncbi:MAG: tetratricopeptide repeat protein [bacterium]|nr:tetratricopeptide repeat protein [bacterium]
MPKRPRKKTYPRASLASPFEPFAKSAALERRDVRNLVIVFCVAFAVRLIFFFLNRAQNPVFFYPIMDGLYHHQWAREILTVSFWGDEVFFRAPLYPYFLAFLYKLSASSISFAVFVQHVLGSLSAALIYLLARSVFIPRIALLAGLLAACYWTFVYFEGDLLIVTLIVLLDLVALVLLARSLKQTGVSILLASGAAIGLSALARPSILIFLLVLPLVYSHKATARGYRSWATKTFWVWLGVTIVITPVLVRNYVVGRDVVPIASQGGVNFYIGNNPESDGSTAVVPGTRWDWWGGYEDAIAMAEQAAGRPLKPSEVSNHYFREGAEFIFGSPGKSLSLFGRKFYLFWAGGERSNNKSIYFFWHLSGMGKFPLVGFWLIAPLGLAGGILLWRRRPEVWLLQLFLMAYMVGVVAFFVNARFRLPMVPVLIIFAAYMIFQLIHVLRNPGTGTFTALGLLAATALAINFDFVHFPENKIHVLSIPRYTLGNAYRKMGDTDAAIREYEKALEIDRLYPSTGFRVISRNVTYNLGRLLWGKGMCGRAIPYLRQVGGTDRFAVIAKTCLGECYLRGGSNEAAIDAYAGALAVAPNDVDALRGIGSAYAAVGDNARAVKFLQQALALNPEDVALSDEIRRLQAEQ